MGYIKKLKNNELVGGTDKTTIYPVTSTEAVFEEITNGNESSFKSQKTINKEQQDELDDHEERIQTAEAEDIKSITINGSTKKFKVDSKNNVDLTIYTVDSDPEMPSIADNVRDLRDVVGTSEEALPSSHKTRIEKLEGGESVTGSVENKIKTKVDSINSSYEDDNNEYVKYSMTQISGKVTDFNIDETSLKNAITSLNTSISGDNIVIRSGSTPSGTGESGKIYRYVNSSNNTYTDYMYSGGSWVTLATHDTSNEQAQVAYYTCTATGSGAQATKQFVGNGSLTYTPSSGGHIKILMGEANTATGTIYLKFGTTSATDSTKKPLYYNGEPASASNTWEAGETIAVYYDPSANNNTGAYFASNAQGGGDIKVKDNYYLDLSVSDDNGYDIVEFASGHVRTKNFDSSEVPTRSEVEESHPVSTGIDDMNDFSIQDGNGFSIVDFSNGHIKTKNFNSEDAVKGDIRKSNILIYRRQLDNDFIHNNVGIIGNWVKRTLNSTPVVSTYSWGSQLVFKVRGTASVVANFILNGSSNSTIGVRVDGGEWGTVNVAESVTVADSLVSDEEHIIQIMTLRSGLSSTTYTQGTGCINFVSLTVAEGAIVTPLTTYNRKILFIGDSITAGAGLLETWKTYSYKLSEMLFAQPVQSCVESSGLTTSTTSWVPHVPDVLKNLISGKMNFINEPDIVFIMIGTNDGGVSASVFTPAYISLLQYIRNRFGGCHIFACSPFNGTHLADTEAATLEFDNITWIDTSTLAGTYTTLDGTHPDAAGAITCANFCFEKINEVINLNYFN